MRLAARLGVEPGSDGEVVIMTSGVSYSLFPLLHAFLDKLESHESGELVIRTKMRGALNIKKGDSE